MYDTDCIEKVLPSLLSTSQEAPRIIRDNGGSCQSSTVLWVHSWRETAPKVQSTGAQHAEVWKESQQNWGLSLGGRWLIGPKWAAYAWCWHKVLEAVGEIPYKSGCESCTKQKRGQERGCIHIAAINFFWPSEWWFHPQWLCIVMNNLKKKFRWTTEIKEGADFNTGSDILGTRGYNEVFGASEWRQREAMKTRHKTRVHSIPRRMPDCPFSDQVTTVVAAFYEGSASLHISYLFLPAVVSTFQGE